MSPMKGEPHVKTITALQSWSRPLASAVTSTTRSKGSTRDGRGREDDTKDTRAQALDDTEAGVAATATNLLRRAPFVSVEQHHHGGL